MNKETRKQLDGLIENAKTIKTAIEELPLEVITGRVDDLKNAVEEIKDGEQEKDDNLSEGLQQSERGQGMLEAVSTLENIGSVLDDLTTALEGINTDGIDEVMGSLQEAQGQ